jgi:hypothetical protein
LRHKTETEDSTRRCGQPRLVQPHRRGGQTAWASQIAWAGLTAQGGGLTALVAGAEMLRAEDTSRDRKACVEAKQVAVAGHPSDEENLKTSKSALVGLVSLVLSKGSLVFWVPPYILIEWMDGSQPLEP